MHRLARRLLSVEPEAGYHDHHSQAALPEVESSRVVYRLAR
jgi:hypothetical protein